jgi:hypothetical protein
VLLGVTAILTDRREPEGNAAAAPLAVATLLAVPTIGWAAVTTGATVVTVAVVLGISGVASRTFRSPTLRSGSAAVAGTALLAELALILHDRSVASEWIGLAVTATAVAMVLVSRTLGAETRPRSVTLAWEAVGTVGAVTGWALAPTGSTGGVIAITAIAVGAVAAAVVRADDRSDHYSSMALIAAVGASTSADHSAAAEGILALGAVVAAALAFSPTQRSRRSWLRFGPALVLGFFATTLLAVIDGEAWRVALAATAATAVVLVGARARQAAPIVIGGAVLLTLAVDGATPVVLALPRWLLIAAAGAMALWAGATADRRLAQVRRWRTHIHHLT